MDINNPHDKFFKEVFSEKLNAVDFIRGTFPPELTAKLDLSQYNNREIKEKVFRRAALWIALWIMKDITCEEIVREHLKKYFELGKLYEREERGLVFIEGCIRYILCATSITPEEIREAAATISRTIEEVSMTTGEKLRAEGLREGIEEGRKEGYERGTISDKQDVLIRQVSKKFGITDEERTMIESVNYPAMLDRALDEILFAESKEVVIKVLKG